MQLTDVLAVLYGVTCFMLVYVMWNHEGRKLRTEPYKPDKGYRVSLCHYDDMCYHCSNGVGACLSMVYVDYHPLLARDTRPLLEAMLKESRKRNVTIPSELQDRVLSGVDAEKGALKHQLVSALVDAKLTDTAYAVSQGTFDDKV